MWDLPLGNPWGMAEAGGLSLLEQDAMWGLRGRSTPVQEEWGTIGEGSLRSLGASRQGYEEGGLHHSTAPWCLISKGERKREPGRRGQRHCQCPLFHLKIQVNWKLLCGLIYGL